MQQEVESESTTRANTEREPAEQIVRLLVLGLAVAYTYILLS